jgi:precorrin-2 dehydrogenase / sirohydrochlorin ferrochelatase
MGYLINLVLQDRHAVVVGAGTVALRKVSGLLEAGARVTVIAPQACEQVLQLAGAGRIRFAERPYQAGDLAGAFLVIAATSDEEVNARVSEDARSLGILVNVVDRPASCTFTLPAVVRRGDLSLAVTTEGRCPSLARALREELEARYGADYAGLLDFMGELRGRMIAGGWDSPRVQRALSELYRRGLLGHLASGNRGSIDAFLRGELGEGFPSPATP